jgi:hypothetical protein
MAVTVDDLAGYANASPADPLLPAILADATELVDEYLGETGRETCPVRTRDLAIRQLGSELFARRNAPGGVLQWTSDGAPIRLARDAMVSVKPLLDRYRGLGAPG